MISIFLVVIGSVSVGLVVSLVSYEFGRRSVSVTHFGFLDKLPHAFIRFESGATREQMLEVLDRARAAISESADLAEPNPSDYQRSGDQRG